MSELTRSTDLQEIAQSWADQCKPGHNLNMNTLKGRQVWEMIAGVVLIFLIFNFRLARMC